MLKKLKWFVPGVLLFIFCFWNPEALAGQDLVVRQVIKVYSERKESSTVLRELDRGDRVPVSPMNYGAWRKVHLRVGGDWKDGWIKVEDLNKSASVVEREGDPNQPKKPIFHRSYSVGGMLTASDVAQGGNTVNTAEGVPVMKGSLSGLTTFFGISGMVPLSRGLALDSEFLFRQLNLTGNFSEGGGPSTPFQVTDSYIGLSMILRSYFQNDGDWWWGGGFEFSYGSVPSITFGGGQTLVVPSGSSSYSTFLAAELAVGVDLNISGPFYVMPEVRFGYVPLLTPTAFDGEVHLAVMYAFQ